MWAIGIDNGCLYLQRRRKERKSNLFRYICRMQDNRLVKEVVFGEMEGKIRRWRPTREWLDEVKGWCNEDIHILKKKAQDRDAWRMIVKCALDTNGWWTHGTLDICCLFWSWDEGDWVDYFSVAECFWYGNAYGLFLVFSNIPSVGLYEFRPFV